MSSKHRVYEVVLTGGPSAGKSTALARLVELLPEHGVMALVVPELATMMVAGGVPLTDLAMNHRTEFLEVERQMLLLQQDYRARYTALGRMLAELHGCNVAVFYDRAEMDCCAYIGVEAFEQLLDETGLNYAQVRDNYDLVLHLVSTAVDLPGLYSTADNIARREDVVGAAAMDAKTLKAWLGAHPVIVDNSTDFEGKLRRIVEIVLDTVGADRRTEIERKFLLAAAPDFGGQLLADAPVFRIEQTYLRSNDPDVERRVRWREHAGQISYFYTEKRPSPTEAARAETEARISYSEYRRLLGDADPDRVPLHKDRRIFSHAGHVFELDSYLDRDLHILEVELRSLMENVALPGELVIEREVTGEQPFKNRSLALA